MLATRGYGSVYDMTVHEPAKKYFEGTGEAGPEGRAIEALLMVGCAGVRRCAGLQTNATLLHMVGA